MKIVAPFFFFLYLLVFQSCAPSIYVTTSTNAPGLTEKFQGNLNTFIGVDHVEGQAAFSPLNHFGLFTNGYTSFNNNNSAVNHTACAEGAAGYYFTLFNDIIFMELYGGYGAGKREYVNSIHREFISTGSDSWYSIQTDYQKTFLQTALVFKQQPNFECALSVKGYYLFFNNLHIMQKEESFAGSASTLLFYSDKDYGKPTVFNTNVALTIKAGFKNIRFITQWAITSSIGISCNLQGQKNSIKILVSKGSDC